MSANITEIPPIELAPTQFLSVSEQNLIQTQEGSSAFNPETDYIEYTIISSPDGQFQVTDIPYIGYRFTTMPNASPEISIEVENDLAAQGYTTGNYNVLYNFLRPILSSSYNNAIFYIKEISSDRTEIKISSQQIDNVNLLFEINTFINQRNTSLYFEDFYLDFGGNLLSIANNLVLDTTSTPPTLLVNLYNPLPNTVKLNDTFWMVEMSANPLSFNVEFIPEVIDLPLTTAPIKGPNFDLPFKNQINNSTNYLDYTQLLTTNNSSSYFQINNLLEEKGLEINIDYDDYANFIHFSSALQRLKNFKYKVQLIEQYNSDIDVLLTVNSPNAIGDVVILESKINNIITNFDGYEYFLYFESGSQYTWPKQNSSQPYQLYSSTSPTVTTWYGSDDLASPYFGGVSLSASVYDQNNQDYLYYTVPEYIRDDSSNDPYKLFIDMMGQMYDNIWVYYKDISNLHHADNRLDHGISKDLVADALRSFGIKIYQNNYSTDDLYAAFLGYNQASGSYYISSSGEYINDYVVASPEAAVEPTDDVNKEVYKRLYHNLPYLLKTKGTIPGLRTLINCYGIPDSILRISEFGGKDRDISTYDYYYQRFSKAFQPKNNAVALIPWLPLYKNYLSTLNRFYVWPVGYVAPVNFDNLDYVLEDANALYTVPDCIQFRFKTTGVPPTTHYSQSLLLKVTTGSLVVDPSQNEYVVNNYIDNYFISDIVFEDATKNWDLGLFLFYTGSGTEYIGPDYYPNYQYGNLRFYLSGSSLEGGFAQSEDIFLPFFDGGWWSVMLQRNTHPSSSQNDQNTTYTLYAANKIYNGYDGDIIGYVGSSSLYVDGTTSSSLNAAWNRHTDDAYLALNTGIFVGGFVSGAMVNDNYIQNPGVLFTGSLQEFKYYSQELTQQVFENFTMNPESIEGLSLVGISSSFDIQNFRAPLGNELIDDFLYFITGSTNYDLYNSVHPASTASAESLITQSFILPSSTFVNFSVDNPNSNLNTLNNSTYTNIFNNLSSQDVSSGPYLSWDPITGTLIVNDTCLGGAGEFTIEGTLNDPLTSTYDVLFVLSSSVRGEIASSSINVTSPYSYFVQFAPVSIYNGELITVVASGSINNIDITPALIYGLSIENLSVKGVTTLSNYQILYYSSSTSASHTENQVETYYFDQPIAGIRNRVNEKINIVPTSLPYVNMFVTESWNIVSQYAQLSDQNYPSLSSEIPDVNLLEVAFSPQNEIDDDIIASLGYFNIGEFIGDPRYISSSNTNYTDLYKLSEDYFKKYFLNYTLYDYIRLIKFFDNSLFKLIKDFIPARTNLVSGIAIKSHLLERNRYPQPQMSWEPAEYSGSIDTAFISGSTGGVLNPYNILISSVPFQTDNENYNLTPSPINPFIDSTPTSSFDYVSWSPETGELVTYFYGFIKLQTTGFVGSGGDAIVEYVSSINGPLGTFIGINNTSEFYPCVYGEKFSVIMSSTTPFLPINNSRFILNNVVPFSNQAWYETTIGPSGSTLLLNSSQEEFYDGEFSGSIIEVTDGELNPYNPFKYVDPTEFTFDTILYQYTPNTGIQITPSSDFINDNTSPNQGEIYLWFGFS